MVDNGCGGNPGRLLLRWNRFKSQAMAYYRALTRDFNYSTDYFFGLDFLMAAAGARYRESGNLIVRRWWNIYRWIIYLPTVVMIWNTGLNVYHGERLEILLSCFQGIVGNVSSVMRMLLILWHYEPLMDVRRYVNLRNSGRILQPSLGIRSEAFYCIRRIVIPAVAIILVVVASFLAVDSTDHHYMKFPVDIKKSFPMVQKLYEIVYCFTLAALGLMTILVFICSYMILTGLMSELKVISLTFAAIFDETNKLAQRKMNFEAGNSQNLAWKEKFYFWKFSRDEFNECIQFHIEFLAIKNRIRPFLNATFLIVYYSAALSLASGAIYMSQMTTLTLFSLESLYYCVWVAIECAFLTRTVSLLTEVNESIGRAVYSLDWTTQLVWDEQCKEEYGAVRRTMLIVMATSQQPLRLNCFGFFEFTQDRFYELLNMAYSVYTFFSKMI